MESGNDKHRLLIENLLDAFACHQLVTDKEGKPVDYIFLEVNPAFETMTGQKREDVIGKKVTEVIPGIEHSNYGWIGTYERLFKTGESIQFEQYSEVLGRYYRVTAYAEGDRCFSTIFQDISDRKEKEERTKELSFLHNFSLLLREEKNDLEKILEETARLLPPSLQDPKLACARITFEERQYKTQGYRSTPWKISSTLQLQGQQVGTIEVCYLELPNREQNPFLTEEKLMLATTAEHLSRVIEQIQAKKVLQESVNKLSVTLHSIGDGVITTGSDGKITRLNRQAEKLTGWAAKEALGRKVEEVLQRTLDEVCDIVDSPIGFYHFVSEDEKLITLKAWSTGTLEHFCETGDLSEMQYSIAEAGVWVDCMRVRHPVIHNDYLSLPHRRGTPEGHVEVTREMVVPIMGQDSIVAILGVGNKPHDYTDQDIQLVSCFADIAWTIAEHKKTEEKIRYFSFHDTLTGLYNRAFLEEEVKRLDTQRQLPISIIMVDLNGLKLVNDTYGHVKGDEMLKSTASILKKSCRKLDQRKQELYPKELMTTAEKLMWKMSLYP